jgi:hypothetical protein
MDIESRRNARVLAFPALLMESSRLRFLTFSAEDDGDGNGGDDEADGDADGNEEEGAVDIDASTAAAAAGQVDSWWDCGSC